MSVSRPTLNYDVLLEVMKACSRPDCARFMRTCQFFYRHGPQALLAHRICIVRDRDVIKLLTYLRKDGARRFKYVRSLYFPSDALSEATAQELVIALPSMTKLEQLHMAYSEQFMQCHPDLPATISALTSLRYLYLTEMGDLAIEMVQNLCSKLVAVSLELCRDLTFEDSSSEDDSWPRYQPNALLSHSESTLEQIHIARWYEFPEIGPERTLTFPKMRLLSLEQPLLPPIAMEYIRTYPNLSELMIFGTYAEYTVGRYYSRAHIDPIRTWNIAQQVESDGGWDALRRFEGSLLDLYVLGLTCLVDEVHFRKAETEELHWIAPVLSYARPSKLKLPNWPGKLHDPDVSAAFRGQSCSRLEELDMEGALWASTDQDVDVAAVLEGLLSALSTGAPLRVLRMRINTRELDPRPDDLRMREVNEIVKRPRRSRRPWPPVHRNLECHPLTFAEQSIDTFNPEDYVRRFAAATPTLQRVEFTLEGPRRRSRNVTLLDGDLHFHDSWR